MIAAVVVTFSAPAALLDRCLRALVATADLDRIVVVDTGGAAVVDPELADRVERLVMENRGYGAAANAGFGCVVDAEVAVLLNDDVVVQPGWLAPLVAQFDVQDRVGAVQPALVGEDHAVVTSLGVELDRFGAGFDIGDGEPLAADRSPRDLEIFNGGTIALSREFLVATGGFDERFFLYYEDVDLAMRGRRLGWTYRLAPESVVEHRRGTSTGSDVSGTLFHQERNRLWTAFRFGGCSTIGRALWLSVRRLRHPPRATHARALGAGLWGVPRCLVERFRGRSAVR